jgi:NAD(P)-dependent dehydrogenase (short-subunit alcohol dehydrogenase family)
MSSETTQRWFITRCSRGLGLEIAKAGLAAGHRVISTARDQTAIEKVLGPNTEHLLSLQLDVTNNEQVVEAVNTAVAHFGGIDVLVNNAGYGQLGFFEENTLEDVREQLETNFIGVLNVTWAVLPAMRAVRKGMIFNISSSAGIRGSKAGSIYCASKFAVEGFSEALAQEVEPLGLSVTIVEPGLFRTGFLNETSVRFGREAVADYTAQSARLQEIYRGLAGQQKGNPTKLARAIVQLANDSNPPLHFAAGSDAVTAVVEKIDKLRVDLDRWRELSLSTDDFEDQSRTITWIGGPSPR